MLLQKGHFLPESTGVHYNIDRSFTHPDII